MKRGISARGELARNARIWMRSHFPGENYQRLAALLRVVATRAYGRGFNDGYSAGHEDQMRARILDAQEREAEARPQKGEMTL